MNNRGIQDLRSWLAQKPPARAVRLDGKTIVKVTTRSNRWSEAEKTITTLGAQRVEALDEQGNVLRARELELEPEAAARVEEAAPQLWPKSELAQMAQIITKACDASAARHENAYRLGFDRMADLVSILIQRQIASDERLEAANRQLQRFTSEALAASHAQEPGEDSETAALVGAVIQGGLARLMAGTPPASRAKPNGAA